MNVLILGGDGYLGWPTAMHFAAQGHTVTVADNYLRRRLAEATDSEPLIPTPNLTDRATVFAGETGYLISTRIVDLDDPDEMMALVRDTAPDTIVHYAEQPSAPYSMRGFKEARHTFRNNLDVTFNLIWAVIEHAPKAHIIKLGTMGEYGTPNIDIPEGWIQINHDDRSDQFLFPRQAGSLYHTTKVLDTDLLWFYVRTYDLAVTDLMQGPVYGMATAETDMNPRLASSFNYDDIFGTVVNRFLTQAVAGVPLTVYGGGGQTRGYLNLKDTLQCVSLAAQQPATPGELRIFNQMTEAFTVNEIAKRIKITGDAMGLDVAIQSIPNPRKELEEHYYNPVHTGLLEMGLQPHFMTEDVIADMFERLIPWRDAIEPSRIQPRVRWAA